MQGMVEIIVPLSIIAVHSTIRALQIPRLVAIVLQDQVDFAIGDVMADRLGDFADYIRLALVEYRVDGVQPQPIEMELNQPIEGVIDEKIAYRPATGSSEIDCSAPRCLMPVSEKGWGNCRQVIPLGSEMVVDHIEKDREAARVARLDEPLQLCGPAVGRGWGIEKGTVI